MLFDLFHWLLILPCRHTPGMRDQNGNVLPHSDKEILAIAWLLFYCLPSSTNLGICLGTATQERIKAPYPTKSTIQLSLTYPVQFLQPVDLGSCASSEAFAVLDAGYVWVMGTDPIASGFEFLPTVLTLNIPHSRQPLVTGQQNCSNRASTWVLLS